ncbi:MAG: hypothetical protein KC777_08210 [Cyanobacteria bacterium HKST-UBA02]|nr:hypothetical protein [Cyanobacteria bacterium HKST-UBA02]
MVFDAFDNCRPCSGDSRGINFDFLDDIRPMRMEGPGPSVFSPGYQSGGPRFLIVILPEVPPYYGSQSAPCWRPSSFRSPYDGIPRLIMDLIERSARSAQGSWPDQNRPVQNWPIQNWQYRNWQNQPWQDPSWSIRSGQSNWQNGQPQNNWRSDYGMPPAIARELARRARQTQEQAWRNTRPGQTGGRWRADYGVAPGLAEELARRAQQTQEQAWRNTRPGQTGGRWRADYGVAPGIGNNLADRETQNKLDAWFLRRSRN